MNDVDNACSCPSGDGSLCHPCPTHPPLADVQAGGRVRLVDADPMRSALEDALQFVETLHSTVSGDSRKVVWRCLERGRAALSPQPSPGSQDAPRCAEHCQNGFADICLASQRDGVICPEDSCDIDDGIRHNHLAAREPVNGLSWADYWMERGQSDVAHDFDAFSRAEAWALQRFPDARQPVGQLTDAEIDDQAVDK